MSYIALHTMHSVQNTLGMLLLGGLGHAPRKILKFTILTLNLEELLTKKFELLKMANHPIHPHWTTPSE